MKIIKPIALKERTYKSLTEEMKRGITCGLPELDKILSFVPGYTSLLFGEPRAGKSQLLIEMLVSMAILHKIKILLYSPESGTDAELLGLLIMNYLGKKLYGDDAEEISISDFDQAWDFINNHFSIISYRDRFSHTELYHKIKESNEHYDIVAIDHVGFLNRSEETMRSPIHEYIRKLHQECYLGSQALKCHTILTSHTSSDTNPVWDKENQVWVSPPPIPQAISGGSENNKNGYLIMSLHRPRPGQQNPQGEPYRPNAAILKIHKARPRYAATEAETELYFNVGRQQYYQIINGEHIYRQVEERIEQKPNINFTSKDFGLDDVPF